MTQVHIVQRLAPGGIEQLVLSLARHADIALFSLEGSTDSLIRDWPILEAFRSRITGFGKEAGSDPGLALRIAQRLRAIAPASVVTHHAGPLLYGGAGARLARIRDVAHVEHDAWHLGSFRRRQIMRAALSLIRPQRFAVSGLVAKNARDGTGLDFEVIVNGIDCERFRPAAKDEARARLGLPKTKRIVGAAGRLERVKGFDLLVEAAALLPEEVLEDVLVVIFGNGSERAALAQQIVRLGLEGRVKLAGSCDAMETAYPAMDIFCLPSRQEGLPLALLEAQACGIPVVARDVGGVREGVCPATGILTVESSDAARSEREAPVLLAGALMEALDRPPATSPRAFVTDHRSLEKTLQAYLAIERNHHA